MSNRNKKTQLQKKINELLEDEDSFNNENNNINTDNNM